MEYRLALSYAGEDRNFVEYIASILKQYLGQTSVFHYTEEGKRKNIEEFFKFINECFQNEDSRHHDVEIMTVCFVRTIKKVNYIVNAQQTELLDTVEEAHSDADAQDNDRGYKTWQGITNSRNAGKLNIKTYAVVLPNHGMTDEQLAQWNVPLTLNSFGKTTHLCKMATDMDRVSAEFVAEELLRDILGLKSTRHSCKAFTYEKDAISFYADLLTNLRKGQTFPLLDEGKKNKFCTAFNSGVPLVWPSVRLRTDLKTRDNALLEEGTIGTSRPGLRPLFADYSGEHGSQERVVVSAALSQYHGCAIPSDDIGDCMIRSGLTFPEAGPRAKIMDRNPVVGIVVGGGIAPGINAVIDGIVRRHKEYNCDSKIYGYRYGLRALSQVAHQLQNSSILLSSDGEAMEGKDILCTAPYVSQGGSVLGTFRLDRLDDPGNQPKLNRILSNIEGLDVLYVIGGDGSMKAANLLSMEVRKQRIPVSIVGIPKTMDNDILWVWQSFGFATAVEKAREVIDCLSTEVQSNPRICVVQLFGSVSGFVVSHAVLSSRSGQCDAALIPEAHFTIKELANTLLKRFRDTSGKIDQTQLPKGMIVMAETAIPDDADSYETEAGLTDSELRALKGYQHEDHYLDGQTSDDLRAASLKLVVHGIKKELTQYFDEVRIFTNEPRHILRASNPSFSDIITGQRLGSLAVDNAMAGYSSFMVSQWLTEFVLIPLRLVSLGRKRIPESGIFWKSVWAKTGQGVLVPPVRDTRNP